MVADDVVVYFYLRSGDDWVDVRVLSVHYPSKNVGDSSSSPSDYEDFDFRIVSVHVVRRRGVDRRQASIGQRLSAEHPARPTA